MGLNRDVPDEPHPGEYIEEGQPASDVPGVETAGGAPEQLHPGVYVDETAPAKSIPGVETQDAQGRGFLAPVKRFLQRRTPLPPAS
jgi:hypothetical protein